jgi:thioredoxin 1
MKHVWILLFVGISTFLVNCNNAQTLSETGTLSADVFSNKLKETSQAIILDVRTPEEFNGGFIAGARNLDYNNPAFKTEIDALDKNKPYFVYCLSGARSRSAANYMRSTGFVQVYDMKGGTLAWTKSDHKLTTASSQKVISDKISIDEYNRIISANKITVVDFYAPWCGPCKRMEPMLEEFARENEGKINVVRLNVDENKQLAMQLGIEEIPVVKIFKNGSETWTHTGLLEKPALVKAANKL